MTSRVPESSDEGNDFKLKLSITLKLWFRGVLEIFNVFRNDFFVRDQVTMPVDHVRYHHDLVRS